MSTDGQGSTAPWRITFDTNPDDCNLHCIMCEEHSRFSRLQLDRIAAHQPKRRMDIALIRRTLEELRGTRLREVIPSTMGEPLLYRHFDEIVEMCHTFGLKLNLTTNGTFPGRGARHWAERIVPVASDVKISWNGARGETQESIMCGSSWAQSLDNLQQFVAVRDAHVRSGGNRCRVTLQMTFLETNVRELPEIVELAAGLGIDRIKGHHLWVHFKGIQGLSMRRDSEAVKRWNQIVEAASDTAYRSRIATGNRVLLDNVFPLRPDALEDIAPGGPCPFIGEEAWVSAEGRFDPCCAPDALRRTLGEFGNLHERSLLDIWYGRAYQELLSSYMNHPLCQKCNMRHPTEGT